jgi:hypothetical protein
MGFIGFNLDKQIKTTAFINACLCQYKIVWMYGRWQLARVEVYDFYVWTLV